MPVRRKSDLIKEQDLNALLDRFEAGTTVDENQVIHFHHLDHQELERILPDAFEADPSFTPRQVRYLLREALWSCRKNGPLTIAGLTTEARRIAKERLAQLPEPYAMWTKFRARQMAFAKGFRLEWNGVLLQTANHLPKYMLKESYFLNGHRTHLPRTTALLRPLDYALRSPHGRERCKPDARRHRSVYGDLQYV